jgi:hypothetical protein
MTTTTTTATTNSSTNSYVAAAFDGFKKALDRAGIQYDAHTAANGGGFVVVNLVSGKTAKFYRIEESIQQNGKTVKLHSYPIIVEGKTLVTLSPVNLAISMKSLFICNVPTAVTAPPEKKVLPVPARLSA